MRILKNVERNEKRKTMIAIKYCITRLYIFFNIIVMNFDLCIDEESRQREERIGSLPVLQPKPRPRPSTATEAPPNILKPPIKPRRSIKCRPVTQPGSGHTHSQANQTENEVTTNTTITQSQLTMDST